jgi:hypothetical protein
MASIELINSLREPLAYGTDYILEYDAARNQYRAKLFNPIYNDSVFHIRMRFAPGDESANPNEAILIDSEAVAAVSERLAHLGYTALANNLNHALTYANGSMTTGDIARVVAKSSDYSFDTNYQPIPSDNPFIALSGFIDHTTGRLQVQCKGANTFLTAILNELLPDGCRAETISCYSLQNIKNQQAGDDPISATISQGNLHARTHIFVGEERIAVIDGTPYSLNHQDVSALPYEQEEGLSPEDERAAFLSILDESLKNIMKEPGLLAHLDRWGDKRAMEPLIDSLRLAAFIQDLSHGVEMSPGRIGGMYETYGEEINENSILTETLLSQWIETATTTLRQAIEYASTKQFIWKELPIYGDGTVVFKTLGILKTAQSLLNVAPNE